MKTKKEEFPSLSSYKRYTAQFKEQALERADRDGRHLSEAFQKTSADLQHEQKR